MISTSIAVLTTKDSWFLQYAEHLIQLLQKNGYEADLLHSHKEISGEHDLVFILSYFSIIPEKYLAKSKLNLVVHESALPQGKGWAPLFWQILEGKNEIPIVLFEALPGVDTGDIYLTDIISLNGTELNEVIRQKQADKTIELCLNFLQNQNLINPQPQSGKESFYPRRTKSDSELDPHKSIAQQFNLLRIVQNEEYPAFFKFRGKNYVLQVHEGELDD